MAGEADKFVVSPHADGISRLTFSPDGRYLYTAGAEGFARIFDARTKGPNDVDPLLCDYHEDAVLSLTASNDLWCSSSEAGQVVVFKAGSKNLEDGFKLLTRFSFPARSVRFDPKGKRIACTADDVIVKVVDVEDPTKVQLLTGHKQPVREASWSPSGSMITTSSTDGQVRVWKLDGGTEATCLQVLDGLVKADDPESEYSIEAIWHPSGDFFAVPGLANTIEIVKNARWQERKSLNGHSGPVSTLAFSQNGKYMVSAGKDEQILIWSVDKMEVVAKTTHTHGLITSIAFHPLPGSNAIAYIDNKGQLTRWTDPIPDKLAPPTNAVRSNDAASGAKRNGTRHRRSDSASTSTSSRPGGGGGDLFRKADDEEEDEFDRFNGDGMGDWIDDDLNEFGMDDQRDPLDEDVFENPDQFTNGRGDVFATKGKQKAEPYTSSTLVAKGQPPFQPGATPGRDKKRYLAFNMVGYVVATDRDDYNMVTIDFHDRSSHVPMHFDDSIKHTIAALGELGTVFAAPAAASEPSKILYKPHQSWTELHDWEASLPNGENATVVAVGGMAPGEGDDESTQGLTGSGAVLVATDRGFVRFFTGAGLQKYVWNVGEEIVTMAAGKDWALIVHRANGTGAGLEFALVDTDNFEVVQAGKVPLPKGTTLKWIGFTDENIPVMYDSKGLISILDRSRRPRQARWLPVLDTHTLARREGKQEDYWPVGIDSKNAHVIILKGEETFPHFPTPLMQELELQFPLLNLDANQGQFEEKLLRESVFVAHRRDGAPPDDYVYKSTLAHEELQIDKSALQLISAYCKAERLEAALDAVLLLSQPASLAAALKVASFFALPALAERIELIRAAKTGEDPDDAASKRQSKYAHLTDERTIPDAYARTNGSDRSRGGAARDIFAPSGTDDFFSPRPSGASSAFGSARKASTPLASSSAKRRKSMPASTLGMDSGLGDDGSDDGAMNDSMMAVDPESYADEEAQASSPGRFRSDSPGEMEQDETDAPPPKKVNPFAKRAPAVKASAPAANPFAGKQGGNSKEVKRTESFFNRVEGTAPPKGKGRGPRKSADGSAASTKSQTTFPGSKQTTLFGFAPSDPMATEKKNKKRKAVDGDEDDDSNPKTKPAQRIDDAFRKPGSAEVAGLGAGAAKELPREGSEIEETQLDETPVRSESRLDLVEEEMEETQTEATQVEETAGKENDQPAAQTSASKLAQFAFKKADPVTVTPTAGNTPSTGSEA
ncbi:hypothetical protein JCM10212_006792 [Sporobolomyces blumeae]